jgi:hypothetical protein
MNGRAALLGSIVTQPCCQRCIIAAGAAIDATALMKDCPRAHTHTRARSLVATKVYDVGAICMHACILSGYAVKLIRRERAPTSHRTQGEREEALFERADGPASEIYGAGSLRK